MSTKFNRILFDYDGTVLIHQKNEEGEMIGKALGLDEEQRKVFSKELAYFFWKQNRYFVDKKVTRDLYFEAMKYYIPCTSLYGLNVSWVEEAITQNCDNNSLIAKGAKETLEYLKQKGYNVCLMTNGFKELQAESMRKKGVLEYFDNIYAWDNWYAKPDPRFIERALDGTNPKENIVVGNDLHSDIEMAQKAGVFTIGFNLIKDDEVKVKPDVEIANFYTLMNIL